MTNDVTTTNSTRLSIELPTELAAEVEAAAKERALGRNMLLELLIRAGLARLRPVGNLFVDD